MAGNAGMIKAGGAYIELMLDKTAALQGLKEFERRFRSMQQMFGRMNLGGNLGPAISRQMASGVINALKAALTPGFYEAAFNRLANGLGTAMRSVFSGQFFDYLAEGFRRAGRNLAIGGLAATAVFTKMSGVISKSLTEFAKQEQLAGRFTQVFGDLAGEAEKFAQVLGKDVNQSVNELKDEITTFQSVLLGAGFDARSAFDLSKMLTEATQDMLAFDDAIRDAGEATDRMLSGLAGMVIPVQRIGADIRKANLDKEMEEMAEAMQRTNSVASQQERILTRIKIIFEALARSGAIGQARREVDTLSSAFRGLIGAVKMAYAALGAAMKGPGKIVVDAFTLMSVAVTDFANANPLVIQGLALLLISLTGLSAAMLGTGVLFTVFAANLKLLSGTVILLNTPFRVLASSMSFLLNVVDLTVIGITTLAAGFSKFVRVGVMATGLAGRLFTLQQALMGLTRSLITGAAAATMAAASYVRAFGALGMAAIRAAGVLIPAALLAGKALLILAHDLLLIPVAIGAAGLDMLGRLFAVQAAIIGRAAAAIVRGVGVMIVAVRAGLGAVIGRVAAGAAVVGAKIAQMFASGVAAIGPFVASLATAVRSIVGVMAAVAGSVVQALVRPIAGGLLMLINVVERVAYELGYAMFRTLRLMPVILARIGQSAVAAFGAMRGLVVVVGTQLKNLGGIIGGIVLKAFVGLLSVMGSLVGVVGSVLGFVASSFASVFAPVLAIVGVIALLGVAFYKLKPYVEAAFSSIGGYLNQIFSSLGGMASSAFSVLSDGFKTLLEDGKTAMGGLVDAISAGDLGLAFEIAWSFIKLEFQKGYNAISESWDAWRVYLLTVANQLWTELSVRFSNGWVELMVAVDWFVDTFGGAWNAMIALVKPLWDALVSSMQSGIESTSSNWDALWDSGQSTVLQVIDLIADAWEVTVNFLIGLWDSFLGILQRAAILARSLVDDSVDYGSEVARIDSENAAAKESRELAMSERILSREKARKKDSEKIMAEKASREEAIRKKAADRQASINPDKSFDELMAPMMAESKAQLELKQKVEEARKAAQENADAPGASALGGWQTKLQEMMVKAGLISGDTAKAVSRSNSAAFADVAAFGLAPDVQENQLRELRRIRQLQEKADKRPAAKAAAGVNP